MNNNDQLKEYWVNVYGSGFQKLYGCKYYNKYYGGGMKPAYRIHVKMDGGYNRYVKRYRQALKDLNTGELVRPNYVKTGLNKLNWMG